MDRRLNFRGALAWASAVWLALSMGACDDGAGGAGGGASAGDLGKACASDADCDDGFCASGAATHDAHTDSPFCSIACRDDADCAPAGLSCGTGPDGGSICTPPCHEPNGYACVEGRSVACSAAEDAPCAQCGCPDDLVCGIESAVCAPRGAVGTPCTADRDCESDNCGARGLCRVAIGAPCTDATCDLCLSHGQWSACSRDCADHDACDGQFCAAARGSGDEICLPVCGSTHGDACPSACHIADGSLAGVDFYCRCDDCQIGDMPPADAGLPPADAATPDDDGGMDADAGR